jgi:hypothetical protein
MIMSNQINNTQMLYIEVLISYSHKCIVQYINGCVVGLLELMDFEGGSDLVA